MAFLATNQDTLHPPGLPLPPTLKRQPLYLTSMGTAIDRYVVSQKCYQLI